MSKAEALAREAAPVFAALGDPTRLQLLVRLGDGRPRAITALTDGARISRQAITKPLRVLEGAGLVQRERVGRQSLYLVRRERIDEARCWLDRGAAQWENALLRLQRHVELGAAPAASIASATPRAAARRPQRPR